MCRSAMLRPALISFTMRFQSSASVFRLASKASFLPRTRSFRLGILSSMRGAEDTFTSWGRNTQTRSGRGQTDGDQG